MMDLWPDRKASCSSTTFLLKLLLQLSSLIFSQHVILPIDGRGPFLGTTLNLRPCPPAALIISLRSLRLGGQLFPTVYHQGWNYGSTYKLNSATGMQRCAPNSHRRRTYMLIFRRCKKFYHETVHALRPIEDAGRNMN
jgi:hypothetical protein